MPVPSFRLAVFFFLFTTSLTSLFAQKKQQTPEQEHKALTKQIKNFKNGDSALKYADSLHALANQLHDLTWKGQIWLAQSYFYYSQGDFAAALDYANQSTAIAKPLDSVTYIKAPLMVAYMLNKQGKDNDALKIAFKTLRITEQHNWKKLLFEANTCVADIYRTMKLSNRALVYAKQAYNISKALKDTSTYLAAISTLSNIYSNKDIRTPQNLHKATALYEIIVSEPYFSTLNDFSKARHLSNMGRLYVMEDQSDKAEGVLLRSIAISSKASFKSLEASALNELMTLKMDQRLYAAAMAYGHRAIKLISGDGGTRTLERDIYNHLTDGYAALKDFENAYKYSEESRTINDSLMAADKAEMAEKMDKDYRSDKRVLQSDAKAQLMKQQRNFITVIGVIVVALLLLTYAWFVNKRKKKAMQAEAERRQMEKLNALKAKFFANISHELRTPLTLILGPIDQLRNDQQEALDPLVKQSYIETVWQNSRKLTRLVNELLDLGKMESSTLSLNLQPVNLNNFIRVIYQGFTSAADFKKIKYELNCEVTPGLTASLDKEKLEKVLNNLISNALKFTPGHGTISIRAANIATGITITVADTGRGIPQKDIDFVFDRYYQVTTEDAVAEGGTGIGLSMAKEYTELMGGKIVIKSTLGEGTVFSIFIPMAFEQGVVVVDSEPYAQDASGITAAAYPKGELILLVEDQLEMASYIASILSPQHQVRMAGNGLEALKMLEALETLPKLIISDVMMPEMDGFELLNKLKAHEVFCRIPVIMLTALADTDNRLNALRIGVDDYLTKPFLSSELAARVVNLINNSVSRSLNPAPTIVDIIPVAEPIEEEIVHVSPSDLKWLSKLEQLVQQNITNVNFDLVTLSSDMAVSERQLHRNVNRITGLTPNRYIRSVRLQMARRAIESGDYKTVAEISYVAGFETPAYFSKLFKAEFGVNVQDLL